MDYAFAYPWAKNELHKETSVYTTRLIIRELTESGGLSKTDENLVIVVVCREGKPVCCDESLDPDGHFVSFTPPFSPKSCCVFDVS